MTAMAGPMALCLLMSVVPGRIGKRLFLAVVKARGHDRRYQAKL
jgi:hypothetical protein